MTQAKYVKRRDYKGLVHYALRDSSVFAACTVSRPTMDDHTVALAWPGVVDDDSMVTCLQCLVLE